MEDRKRHILITDDEANIRLMLRTALESSGYEVSEASNGREALDAIASATPDLLLLDLSMPVLDGMGVLQQLQDAPVRRRPRVVVLTAYGSVPKAVQAMRLGASDFLEKPVTPDDLRLSVAAVLDEPREFSAQAVEDTQGGTYDEALAEVRSALRDGSLNTAEALLIKAGSITDNDASFLNLAGVFHEAMGRKDMARRFYGRAIRADGSFAPAQQNMRRLYELSTFGHTTQHVALGDEPEFLAHVGRSAHESLATRLARLLRGRAHR